MDDTPWFHDQTTEEAKAERATLREIVVKVYTVIGALCVLFLIALAATWPTQAYAEEESVTMVAEVGTNRLFLFKDPCPLGGWFAKWKRAEWIWDGKPSAACWMMQRDQYGNAYAHTVDDMGEPGVIPLVMFRKADSV